MRDIDERVAAVQGRARQRKRKHDRNVAGAVATCAVLAFAGLMGMPVMSGQMISVANGSTLFGASSLFGASAGGYVLVAVAAAVVAVAVTVFLMRRLASSRNDEIKDTTKETGKDAEEGKGL